MKSILFKKQTLAIVLVLVLITGAGCRKFLDQQPITEVSTAIVFSDVDNAYKALIGAYSRLVGDQAYGIRLSLYFPLDNDEMQGPGGGSDNDRRDIARYEATAGNSQLAGPFNQLFQGIEFANICIDNIPKMDMYASGSEQQKKQLQRMYGEALTLRAQFYFEAIRNWGDLPMHFTPAAGQAIEDPFPVRTNSDTLYDRIIADLDIAEGLVPWVTELSSIGDVVDERITKGTVKGLRARIALFRGGYSLRQTGSVQRSADYRQFYQIARDETSEIISSNQHGLNPSFKSLWKDQVGAHAIADPDRELMFQASGIGLTGAEDTKLGYYNGPRMNNNGNSSVTPLPTYFYLFDSSDLRRDVTIAPYNVSATLTKIGLPLNTLNDGKYRRDWTTNPSFGPNDKTQYLGLNWQILRYADVLLMFAEAENELNGPTGAAYNALNMVRRRGFGKPVNSPDPTVDVPPSLSKEEFFKYIVRERALELGGEGVRKYDLIRWNLLGQAIGDTKTNLLNLSNGVAMIPYTYMAPQPSYTLASSSLPIFMYYRQNSTADDKTLWFNSFYKPAPTSTPSGTSRVNWRNAAVRTGNLARYATGYTPGKSELLPIPQSARNANFRLTQNPGY